MSSIETKKDEHDEELQSIEEALNLPQNTLTSDSSKQTDQDKEQ